MYTISIITVVKDNHFGILQTIQSIKAQTSNSNIEHIIIDGASTDRTLEVIENNKITKSIVLSEEDEGLYFAMNKGLSHSTGDFCLFMNSGDVFYNNMVIETVLKRVKESNRLYSGNTQVKARRLSFLTSPLDEKKISTNYYLPHHQSVFFPKAFYKKNQYDTSFSVLADEDYTFRACQQFELCYINTTIITSVLNGFAVSKLKSINGHALLIREEKAIIMKHKGNFFFDDNLRIFITHFIKYAAVKIMDFDGIVLCIKMGKIVRNILRVRLYFSN